MFYIYRHIRLDKNEPFYIGIGTKPLHFTFWKREFNRAFSKMGRSNWWKSIVSKTEYEVEILFESDDLEEIKRKEIEFIALYGRKDLGKGTLVNMTDGGDGANGCICSEEKKKYLSEKNKGQVPPNKGKFLSDEEKEQISISTKIGMIDSNCGRPGLKIIQEINNSEFTIWNSIIEAANTLGIDRGSITKVCKNQRKTCGGFKWRYEYAE